MWTRVRISVRMPYVSTQEIRLLRPHESYLGNGSLSRVRFEGSHSRRLLHRSAEVTLDAFVRASPSPSSTTIATRDRTYLEGEQTHVFIHSWPTSMCEALRPSGWPRSTSFLRNAPLRLSNGQPAGSKALGSRRSKSRVFSSRSSFTTQMFGVA